MRSSFVALEGARDRNVLLWAHRTFLYRGPLFLPNIEFPLQSLPLLAMPWGLRAFFSQWTCRHNPLPLAKWLTSHHQFLFIKWKQTLWKELGLMRFSKRSRTPNGLCKFKNASTITNHPATALCCWSNVVCFSYPPLYSLRLRPQEGRDGETQVIMTCQIRSDGTCSECK